MRKTDAVTLAGFLGLLIAILGGVSVYKGVFLIATHEGDTLHLMQILMRMADGEIPHLDFMTPIGIFAFAPISVFMKMGYGVGFSILASQVLVAALLLPGVVWVGISRLKPGLAMFFGASVMVLSLALVHGRTDGSLSISMHYNRWAWGFAFVAIALSFLPPVYRRSSAADGIFAGSAVVALAMIKATYFAAFFLPVAIGFLLNRRYGSLAVAIVTGLIISGAITLWLSPDFWVAYVDDLLTVASSEVRPFPGRTFNATLVAPAFFGGSVVAFLSVIFLRQAGRSKAGLLLLLLLPGFFYVTWQNFANDPQWLLLVAVLLLASRPVAGGISGMMGWDARTALTTTAIIALTLIGPSFINLAYSTFRHAGENINSYSPLLPRGGVHADIMTSSIRANRTDGIVSLDTPGSGLGVWAELADREETGTLFGAPLPSCKLTAGMVAWLDAIVTDMTEAGFAEGRRVFAADVHGSHWMFGGLLPLEGGAPWYYGGLPGFESADYVLVPLCPVSVKVRRQIIELINAEGTRLEEVRRTPLYILLEKV